jgi:DNA-binding response OmpR family regulator
MLVLIADDDETLRLLLRYRLEAKGCHVQVMSNGTEVIERLSHSPLPDAVILDAMMPEMDGLETLRHIREQPILADLPVLLLTARRGEQDVVEGLRLGASDYLTKPFVADELLLRLQRLTAARGGRKGA